MTSLQPHEYDALKDIRRAAFTGRGRGFTRSEDGSVTQLASSRVWVTTLIALVDAGKIEIAGTSIRVKGNGTR